MVGFGPCKRPHGLKEIYDVPDSLFHKRMDFEWSLGFEGIYQSPVRTFTWTTDAGEDIGFLASLNPKVLFLDEPTIGVGRFGQGQYSWAITQIVQEEEATILLTTHDLSDIEQLCDPVFMIDKGRRFWGNG